MHCASPTSSTVVPVWPPLVKVSLQCCGPATSAVFHSEQYRLLPDPDHQEHDVSTVCTTGGVHDHAVTVPDDAPQPASSAAPATAAAAATSLPVVLTGCA